MARGWESKGVELQVATAKEAPQPASKTPLTEKQKATERERQGLLLARANIVRQIEAPQKQRYRKFLIETLEDLDRKIAALDGGS